MPDHLHTIWELPENDSNFSKRWNLIKSSFARELIKRNVPLQKNRRREYQLWQRRFWEHTIKDELDLERHINYIHYNPVKHDLVLSPKDWPCSSFHYYVKQKILPWNWSEGKSDKVNIDFGE